MGQKSVSSIFCASRREVRIEWRGLDLFFTVARLAADWVDVSSVWFHVGIQG
jgi:hypothetical protein